MGQDIPTGWVNAVLATLREARKEIDRDLFWFIHSEAVAGDDGLPDMKTIDPQRLEKIRDLQGLVKRIDTLLTRAEGKTADEQTAEDTSAPCDARVVVMNNIPITCQNEEGYCELSAVDPAGHLIFEVPLSREEVDLCRATLAVSFAAGTIRERSRRPAPKLTSTSRH